MAIYSYITELMLKEEQQQWHNLMILASRIPNETDPDVDRLFQIQLNKWIQASKISIRLAKTDHLYNRICSNSGPQN